MSEELDQYRYEKAWRWIQADPRAALFRDAISFINYERVPGDILEFGTGIGKSLAFFALAYAENLRFFQYTEPMLRERKIVGFDAWAGLPAHEPGHPRWEEGSFARNYDFNHPFLEFGAAYGPDEVRRLFAQLGLEPALEQGWFEDSLPALGTRYRSIAILHIDCDLYEPARAVLEAAEPLLQQGTLLLFDDYFCYKGDPQRGEAHALAEFLAAHPKWFVVHYRGYSTFGNAFILQLRET